jgi:hypothetical protein
MAALGNSCLGLRAVFFTSSQMAAVDLIGHPSKWPYAYTRSLCEFHPSNQSLVGPDCVSSVGTILIVARLVTLLALVGDNTNVLPCMKNVHEVC